MSPHRRDLTRARWAARIGAALLIATALIPGAPNDLRGAALVWAGAFVLVAVACGSELRHLTRKEANRGYLPRHRR